MGKALAAYLFIFYSFTTLAQCGGTLIWSDEFTGSTLDLSKWSYETGDGCPSLCGWGNSEMEYYTTSTNNLRVGGGLLTIEARAESIGGSSFTSGKINTLGKFNQTYGRFEARIRLPEGRGLWPAFWMLATANNWPTSGEIDILEYRGDMLNRVFGTLHYGNPWPGNLNDGAEYFHSVNDLHTTFHTYAVEWEPGEIRWYFDNVRFKTETETPNSLNPASNNANAWPWNTPFYIILNQAVGGWFPGTTNPSDVVLTKPTFEIDYVRVYDMSSSAGFQVPYSGTPSSIPGTIQAEDFDRGCADAAYSDNELLNQGTAYRQEEVDIEVTADGAGAYNVGYINTGEWMEYTVNVPAGGLYNFLYRVASQTGGGVIRMEIDGVSAGTVNINATGGWQVWQTVNLNSVTLGSGNHIIRIVAQSGGFNFNYFGTTLVSLPSNWIEAHKTDNEALISWIIPEACNQCMFEVQVLEGTIWRTFETVYANSDQLIYYNTKQIKESGIIRVIQYMPDGQYISSNIVHLSANIPEYHPNPFTTELYVLNTISEPVLLDVFGRILNLKKVKTGGEWLFYTEELQAGIYFIRNSEAVIRVVKR